MKVKTDYEHTEYITAGKEYEVVEYDPKKPNDLCAGATIKDDDGDEIYVLLSENPECSHLDGSGVWEVSESTLDEENTNARL